MSCRICLENIIPNALRFSAFITPHALSMLNILFFVLSCNLLSPPVVVVKSSLSRLASLNDRRLSPQAYYYLLLLYVVENVVVLMYVIIDGM